MRFSAPTALKVRRVGMLLGSTQAPSPYGLSQTLEGFVLVNPAALFHAAVALGVLSPFRAFPCRETPAGFVIQWFPSWCSFGLSKETDRTSRGLSNSSVRTWYRSIASETKPMLSWGFHHFHGSHPNPI
jgi:hypothetical protein